MGKTYTFYHPFSTQDLFHMKASQYASIKPLLEKKMENGKKVAHSPSLPEIQKRAAELIAHFDKSYKRQINPHIYKVSLSEKLRSLKTEMIIETRKKEDK